jgi:GTP cyclohydrolase II
MPATPSRPPRKTKVVPTLDRVARGVDAFRRGEPVLVSGTDSADILALAVETAADDALAAFDATDDVPPLLLLTHWRARTLKIRLYTPEIAAIVPERPLRAARLRAVADPTADLAEPFKGPFETLRHALPETYPAAVKLAKLAGLLPSVIVRQAPPRMRDMTVIPAAAIRDYDADTVRSLALVTRARVPLAGAEQTELAAFRAGNGEPEHFAIIIGRPPTDRAVLTRLHSECFTGDLLDSLKCDCGAQLRGAIETIAKAGGGILLYLAQEGRGIGLINKLRAYRLQDQGFDTIEANERLGFDPDERRYGIAARMLGLLGYKSIRLLTNNPDKVLALEAAGMTVVERVPHAFPDNVHNRAYLETKAAKAGHLL